MSYIIIKTHLGFKVMRLNSESTFYEPATETEWTDLSWAEAEAEALRKTDKKGLLLEEAELIAANHPSKDAQSFAQSVIDFLR